jgi:energy-coupling factor transport system substrate-specific component
MEELKKGRGTQFDPKLVDIFFELIEEGSIRIRREENQ